MNRLVIACFGLLALGAAGAAELECTDWATVHKDWIWCDDFESDASLERNYFEVNRAGGRMAVVAGQAYGGVGSLESKYARGEEEGGNVKLSFGKTPVSPTRYLDRSFEDIYWRFYMKTESAWEGQPMKVSRAIIFSASNWSQALIGHIWEDGAFGLGLDPATGVSGSTVITTGWNDFAHLRWLGKADGSTQVYASENRNKWFCIEVHLKLNTPNVSDGIFEFWIDDRSEARKNGLNWRSGYTTYGVNALTLEAWINGGAPKDQSRYFDNFVVSTARIGCGGAIPAAPRSLVAR